MTCVCCCSCFNILKQKCGPTVAEIWREFCTHPEWMVKENTLLFPGYDTPELRKLEKMRYIMTHEIEGYIIIKLLGEKQDCMNQSLFCPGGNHV